VDDTSSKGRMWVQIKGLVPDEFLPGTVRPVEIFGRRYAVARTEEGFFAALDRCPHAGGSLGEGSLEGDRIVCSMHGKEFDVHDGSCATDSDLEASVVEVKVQDDKIFVETDR
jgi:nitrite reductase/ring-hydroxylating ferredoxin subunit